MSQGIRTNQPDQICRPDQELLGRRRKKIARKGERPVHFGVVHAAPRQAPVHIGQFVIQNFLSMIIYGQNLAIPALVILYNETVWTNIAYKQR